MKPASQLLRLCLTLISLLVLAPGLKAAGPIEHVIHISVDGLRGDVVSFLGPTNLPNFYRLRTEGAFTDNARTDYDYTETLPNHTCQVTGRGVLGATGHNWSGNVDPQPGQTLASNRGFYVAGVFDVAHDNGLRTGEFASKTKFSLWNTSWDAVNGALDVTGADNGRDKIDSYVNNSSDTLALVNTLISQMNANPFGYAFLHLMDPDSVGHSQGWYVTNGSAYCNIIKTMDGRLGKVFELVDNNPVLKGRTAIVLTADHGGGGPGAPKTHVPANLKEHYTIPFYVWGPGVMPGADLYAINPTTRLNPGTARPAYSASVQPIRNGEAANVSLTLLGLGSVPGSTINSLQNLAFSAPAPLLALKSEGGTMTAQFVVTSGAQYDLEACEDFSGSTWTCISSNIVGTVGSTAEVSLGTPSGAGRFYRLKAHF